MQVFFLTAPVVVSVCEGLVLVWTVRSVSSSFTVQHTKLATTKPTVLVLPFFSPKQMPHFSDLFLPGIKRPAGG